MRITNFYGVKNQFLIEDELSRTLQSYQSKVAEIREGNIYLFNDWDYSKTTLKYVAKFLSHYSIYNVRSKKDILALIKDNKITLN